ncbi:hypothetical protein BOX15_Mlig004544g1 [Macrostomum lignano]|uniref:Uncharacterized protein n=1 Tax=Macrostomum lignano TaxID=282301 RepID=A0A267EVS6_9PLAT|nr:hypothetical protein BOX15_Mlig004544g1 [Macrostomum lignano]
MSRFKQRVSLEGCELQLKPSSGAAESGEQHLARMRIRNPPKVYQHCPVDEAQSKELKYSLAPHLRHLSVEETINRDRLMSDRQIGYKELSLSLAWPMLACGSVHPDLYRRSVAMATQEHARTRLAERDPADDDVAVQSHRRRKDPVLSHEERVFNQDRVLRSLDK